jgi:hypothetical protein
MGLRAKLARFLLFFPLLGLPLAAQPAIPLAPCRSAEPAPDLNKESNPTTRDAVVMHSDGGADSLMVTAEACLVLGTKQQILPGQGYGIPDNGLYLDWGFALVTEGGRFVDVQGTVSRTGAVTQGGPASISIPLILGWNLGPNQPNPSTNKLFTQVAVWPCQDATSTCNPDQHQQREVTRLLGSPDTTNQYYHRATYDENQRGPGCLAPIVDPKNDPELRQVTVIAHDNQYLIFACLVSNTYKSFSLAGFDITPRDAHQKPTTQFPGGNTRLNIGRLYHRPSEHTPNVVTLLAVQIPSLAPSAPEVKFADINIHYIGCSDENEAKCDPSQVDKPYRTSIEFYTQ